MVGDIEEASRRNELAKAMHGLELVRLELEASRFESADLRQKCAAMSNQPRPRVLLLSRDSEGR